jgi:RNA polymerase sigma-70 factor (ECF subfamily)
MKVNSSKETDEVIAKRVQGGDKEAFGLLVERYEAKLTRYCRRFLSKDTDIEDLVQDVFIKAYQNILSFDTSARFSPWIYRIAHNTFVNALKQRSRNPLVFFDFDVLLSHPDTEDPAEAERERHEMRQMLDRAMSGIAEKYREVLILYYFEELDYKEIAEVLRVPSSTVGVRLRRGRVALKAAYENINTHGA